jgi:hypothetical protein
MTETTPQSMSEMVRSIAVLVNGNARIRLDEAADMLLALNEKIRLLGLEIERRDTSLNKRKVIAKNACDTASKYKAKYEELRKQMKNG